MRILSYILMIVGIVVMYLFLFADEMGLGQSPAFGWNQQVGAVIGSITLVIGAILGQIRRQSS